jgi:hypothetical protein
MTEVYVGFKEKAKNKDIITKNNCLVLARLCCVQVMLLSFLSCHILGSTPGVFVEEIYDFYMSRPCRHVHCSPCITFLSHCICAVFDEKVCCPLSCRCCIATVLSSSLHHCVDFIVHHCVIFVIIVMSLASSASLIVAGVVFVIITVLSLLLSLLSSHCACHCLATVAASLLLSCCRYCHCCHVVPIVAWPLLPHHRSHCVITVVCHRCYHIITIVVSSLLLHRCRRLGKALMQELHAGIHGGLDGSGHALGIDEHDGKLTCGVLNTGSGRGGSDLMSHSTGWKIDVNVLLK